LLDAPLPAGPLQPLLRSGEVLCEAANAVRPGLVAKVARAELLDAMSESRRNARMRENIGQFIDACAELGVDHRELFLTADLFENKNFKAVLKSILGLARHAHHNVSGFVGPHVGVRGKRSAGSGVKFGVAGSGVKSGVAAAAKPPSDPAAKSAEMASAVDAGVERERSASGIESTRF